MPALFPSAADVVALTSSRRNGRGDRMARLGVLLIVFAFGFVVAALLGAHAYRGTHTGFVLWACGPGVEVTGNPRGFMEQCR